MASSAQYQIELHSDGLLLLLGPTGYTDPSTPTALNGGTCTGRIFDNARRSLVAVDGGVNSADVQVAADDGALFTVGESVHVRKDDRTHHLAVIDSIAIDVITLDTVIGAGRHAPAKDWNSLAVQLGADISMTVYGTPIAKGNLWGYVGNIDYNLDVLLAMDLRAEIEFNGGSGLRKYVILPSIRVVEGG